MNARAVRRGIVGVAAAIVVWEVATQLDAWVGVLIPFVGTLPPPSDVVASFADLVRQGSYWSSWRLSFERVLLGFGIALAVGIPLGLVMATSRTVKRIVFPVFETLRPIPPLAWVPLAILFWPTQELSIAFVTFLGAFFAIVLNTLGGAQQIDRRLLLSARSMGAGRGTIFRRVILPAALPSIVTGAAVGMGITWEVVVAAELISGGGSGGADGGLGFLVWNSYQGNDIAQVVVGMISLGVAGYISSAAVRALGSLLVPWARVA